MALVSEPRPSRLGGANYHHYRRRRRAPFVIGGLIVLVVLLVAGGLVALASGSASLSPDSAALAKVAMPLGGGRIESVSVVAGQQGRQVPATVRGDAIWPTGKIRTGQRVHVVVVVKRPGWISWLTGGRELIRLTLVAPIATPRSTFVTLGHGTPLRLAFDHPVAVLAYGPSAGGLRGHALASPTDNVILPHSGTAGTLFVSGIPRTWETTSPTPISWFPAGSATSAVASPMPGSTIGPASTISLTFSKTVSAALGHSRPPVSPATAGAWQQISSHTIVFHPSGYGYGLGARVRVGLPGGVNLVGGSGGWHVPPGSTLRLQQLLATLGYLPLNFSPSSTVGTSAEAQEAAAIHPPAGSFSWRWGNVPSALRNMWAAGTAGEMTKGAVMAFENDQGMTADGVAGPEVWKALIGTAATGRRSTFGYTFVMVSEATPESINVWHSGRSVVTGPANTGIPQAPTAKGVFAVFEHAPSVTMSGTNPDGSHYNDPGVPWVSYFNGGDALHGFLRASYGSAQSLGCVEMPYSEAHAVYPYTPIGTLVAVS